MNGLASRSTIRDRSLRMGWPARTELVQAGAVTAHATPHTKGAWVDVVASLAGDICGFYMYSNPTIHVSNTDTSQLMDFGIGGTGDAVDSIRVSDIPLGGSGGGNGLPMNVPFIPMQANAGERLAARIQAAITVDVYTPLLILCYTDPRAGFRGYDIGEAYGINSATSAPTTADLADNAWDEAVASTTNPVRALTFHPCIPPATVLASTFFSIDVGIGGAGSEVVLGTYWIFSNATESIGFMGVPLIEAAIPAGSRLALRKNDVNAMSGALIGWR